MWDRAADATDRRLVTVSASLPASPGRLKAAWQSRGSGGGGRRAGRRHCVMAEMREGESRYFISGKRKREER